MIDLYILIYVYNRDMRNKDAYNCIINDTLLETVPDIDQALIQFIDVMNLLDTLLHFFPIFCNQPGSGVCDVRWPMVW